MTPYLAEFIGTAILLFVGNGTNCNMLLSKTKGHGVGFLGINVGWGLAVFLAVFCVGRFSGAHLNPAVTVGLAFGGHFDWAQVLPYMAFQFLGAAFGTTLASIFYWQHYGPTEDTNLKLATFCTSPAIRCPRHNLVSEILGTFVLVFAVFNMVDNPSDGLGALDALPVGLTVLVIGVALGGTTGYAINPARDLGPRVMHALLPLPGGKRDSDWSYAWIPVVGGLAGGVLAGALWALLVRG
ncbi:MAG: MIP/aquaporin family protein [Sumerlaeia bacterium]